MSSGLIGQTLGNFKIVAQLGVGGMGVVYAAEHTLIGKKAAVKVLLPRFSQNADIVQRFFNEAKTAATLQHPGIIDVFDYGKLPTGEAYLVMDFLQGESLTERLKRDGVVPLAQLVGIARQVAAAVGAAHGKGIVHRDLKPDNVYLEPDAAMPFGIRVKVIDFGIAKLADEGSPDEVKTQAGELLGTPFYMSPEQCKGAGDVDHRSDIYALGCIVYQMATGTVPFDAKGTGALIAAHIYEEPPPPRTIDANLAPALEQVILRALAKDPGARQQTMDALIAELDATLSPPAPASVQNVSAPTVSSPSRRSPALLIAVGALVVAGIGVALFASRGKPATPAAAAHPPGPDAALVAAAPPDAAPPDAAPVTCDTGDLAVCVAGADRIAADDPTQAATLYKKACDGGVVAGCVRLGLATERGRGVERDLTRAFAVYLAACDKKDADACALLASMYEDGKGVTTDTGKAVALYTHACEAGSGMGCTGLGVLTAMGQGVPVDTARALQLFDKACSAGDPIGCLRAGRAYQRGLGTEPNADKAGAIWSRLVNELPARCSGGDARACDVVGVVKHQGLAPGTSPDFEAAASILRGCQLGYARACSESAALAAMKPNSSDMTRKLVVEACDGGDDLGCALLGKALIGSNEIEHALTVYERACAGGGESGCSDLAGFYDAGGPVPQDQARATTLFKKACDGGSFRGCLGLGSRLGNGIGARKDERRARLAAEKGCKIEPSACWMYARYLATGLGGAVDLEQARKLYTVACEAGEESACPYKDNPLPPDAAVPLPDAGVSVAPPP